MTERTVYLNGEFLPESRAHVSLFDVGFRIGDGVYDVAWSHNGTHINTGSSDKTVSIWDPKAGKILRMLKGHSDTV